MHFFISLLFILFFYFLPSSFANFTIDVCILSSDALMHLVRHAVLNLPEARKTGQSWYILEYKVPGPTAHPPTTKLNHTVQELRCYSQLRPSDMKRERKKKRDGGGGERIKTLRKWGEQKETERKDRKRGKT